MRFHLYTYTYTTTGAEEGTGRTAAGAGAKVEEVEQVEDSDSDHNGGDNASIASSSLSPPSRLLPFHDQVWRELLVRLTELMEAYTQPVKIATAITFMSMFAILDQLVFNSRYDALWAAIAVGVIRQENVSSSFLVGYQRLEGTAIGALYAYATYTLAKCDKQECGIGIQLSVLVPWLLLTAAFREGPRHGYAAQTAGLTPLVIFLGSVKGLNGGWTRILETVFGVGTYLLIDNLVFPSRADKAVRQGVLLCTEDARVMVSERYWDTGTD
jgi:hypothetical protein